jgi:hydroxymethylbilane synthase
VRLVLATRRSALALAQAEAVAAALRASGHEVELLPLVTTGDRRSRAPGSASAADVTGLFVKELEEALLAGDADLAVHSAKDLPTDLPPGLAVLAVPERADPRDVLVAPGGLEDLPPGSRIGTGSPRRREQLREVRPDLIAVDVRGNVDTRLAKLRRGEVDGLVLAAAGLARLGIDAGPTEPLDPAAFVPAPGQGCLALEGCLGRDDLAEAAAAVDDPAAHAALRAERAFLAGLGGGCLTPVGALGEARGGELRLLGYLAPPGGRARRGSVAGAAADAERLGLELARTLGAGA